MALDTDPAQRGMLTEILELEGYDVRSFDDAGELLAELGDKGARAYPGAIIVGLSLPHLGELDVIGSLHRDISAANVPLLVLSELPASDPRLAIARPLVDRFLAKPVVPRELHRALVEFCGAVS